jgi:hypothetical protein
LYLVRDVVVPLVRANKEAEAEAQVDWFTDSLAKLGQSPTGAAAMKLEPGSSDAISRSDGKKPE